MKTRIISLLAIILLFTQIGAEPIARCGKRQSVFEELNDSTAVFSGKVVAEEYRPINPKDERMPKGGEALVVRFAVERWWKGSGAEEIVLYTADERYPGGINRLYSEDFKFSVGKKYLVYAIGSEDKLRTNICRRTAELGEAEKDLEELGEGKLPEKER